MSDIQFVEVDSNQINTDLVNNFEEALGDTLYPGDERRIFLDQETQLLVGLKNNINETGKQNLLRFATGDVLDTIGERTDTKRLPAQNASTTLRFTLSTAQTSDILIPAGTRATPDGNLYFTTTALFTIPSGQTYGDISAQSIIGGQVYNNFAIGQIKTIVDPIPYVASVQNTTVSSGGADIEPDDDGINVWSGYRERIRQAPASFSTAGPEDAYIYWAKTADANIQDVAVTSPSAGQIKINVLMKNGDLPTQTTLDAVLAICSDKKRRPLTDYVTVSSPNVVSYDVNVTYYISQDNLANELNIRNAIELAGGIIDNYKLWQDIKLGRDINPDYLRQLMLNAGAFRIDLISPAYTPVNVDSKASINTITINYGGLL